MTDSTPAVPEVLRTRDFIGWEVVDREGEKVGSVGELLIDRRGRIRYVDVQHGLPRKHLLLPVEQLEWGDGRFVIGWPRDRLMGLPPYDPDAPLEGALLDEMRRAFPWMYDAGAEPWSQPVTETRVVPLSEARDFKVAKGATDLRGWNVFGSDGERVGTVTQHLVDPAALMVRYLDVDVHEDLFRLKDDRHVLVPIEIVDLKERGNDAWVRGLTAAEVARLPAYTGGPVTEAMESVLRRVVG